MSRGSYEDGLPSLAASKTIKVGFKAQLYIVKTQIQGAVGAIAPLIGKQPSDIQVWLVKSEAPTFIGIRRTPLSKQPSVADRIDCTSARLTESGDRVTLQMRLKLVTFMRRVSIACVILLLFGACLAQPRPIDPHQSVLMVHVFKSGLFSAFADNHAIRAPISSGSLDEAARRVDLLVDSSKLVVLDPNLPPDKRQQVQERMLGPEVLDSSHFHEIRFDASSIKQATRDHFLVSGNLSLHGKTRPITLKVSRSGEHFRGEATLKQSDFGIAPISIAGGTVKVKDELKIEFDVVTGASSPNPRISSNRKPSSAVAE